MRRLAAALALTLIAAPAFAKKKEPRAGRAPRPLDRVVGDLHARSRTDRRGDGSRRLLPSRRRSRADRVDASRGPLAPVRAAPARRPGGRALPDLRQLSRRAD